ncbi:MFS multidrug transporter [Pochonia chlamydosporia 170]|uniref:MFS multidrug transporter n=1 Tax=Pochonia chlamydosporia 170 TaxID=1380566 RepID=A0A179FLS3_METCM|nr:MFS multidrug transporter [Pochonia chlamydosporia 170]OAQ65949.1 MFS multidrug transporter [Pochonia chlamydosporia 170]
MSQSGQDGQRPSTSHASSETTSQSEASKPPPISIARFWLLCVGVCLGLFLGMVDTSIVATSLYAISTEFDNLNDANWVALSYTLAYMGCAVVFSRISDITGRRDAFVAAYIIFVSFSLACGFAQNMHQLIAFRALQGIGGSGLYTLALIILPELSPIHLRELISAVIGLVVALSGVLGPVLGGLLTDYTTWRWVFWINGLLGAVSLAIFLLSWPKAKYSTTPERQTWKQLDYPGSFLTIAAAVLVAFAFQNAGQTPGSGSLSNDWRSALFIAPVVLGLVCWAGLLVWEYAVQNHLSEYFVPVFPLRIFRSGLYTCGVINTLLLGFPYLMLVYVVPLRIQVVGGKSALLGGVMLLPMLGTVAIGTILGGAVNAKKSVIVETMFVGSCLMLLGCGLLTTLSTSTLDSAKLLGFITFCGLGFGLAVTSSTIIPAIKIAPKDYAPAQGILAQLRVFGGSLGIAASTAIVRAKASGIPAKFAKRGVQAPDLHGPVAKKIYAESFRNDMIASTAVSGLAVLLVMITLWQRRNKPRKIAS